MQYQYNTINAKQYNNCSAIQAQYRMYSTHSKQQHGNRNGVLGTYFYPSQPLHPHCMMLFTWCQCFSVSSLLKCPMAQTKQTQFHYTQCLNHSILVYFYALCLQCKFNMKSIKSHKHMAINCKLYLSQAVQQCYGYATCSWSFMALGHFSLLLLTDIFLPFVQEEILCCWLLK